MKTNSLRTACLLLLTTGIGMAQSEPREGQELPTHGPFFVGASCPDFILGSRPTDRKEEGDYFYDLWVQMAGERGEYRVTPTIFPDGETNTLNASCAPVALVSPDARWVALDQKFCTHYAIAYVLQRDEEKGFKPLPKLVSEMGWDTFMEQNPKWQSRRERMSGITSIGSSICDLVAWEPDASGVWYSLRGGGKRGEGVYQWYFFWDAKTREVTTPEKVKIINQFANDRWTRTEKAHEKTWAEAEEKHFLFISSLEWRITHPDEPVEAKQERFRHKWHSAHADPAVIKDCGKEMGDTSPASISRWIIARQLKALFNASLRAGAVAHMEDP